MSAERVDQPVPNHGIPGKTLAAEREALGWTVEQVADQLKLAVRQVVALEEGDIGLHHVFHKTSQIVLRCPV